ncbi:MAG: hypothetical protein CO150_01900, partial [Nitrospirae bacterium CG_4_9_14_3_um_filter_53_35]
RISCRTRTCRGIFCKKMRMKPQRGIEFIHSVISKRHLVIPRLDRGIQLFKLDCPVKPDNDKQPKTLVILYNIL